MGEKGRVGDGVQECEVASPWLPFVFGHFSRDPKAVEGPYLLDGPDSCALTKGGTSTRWVSKYWVERSG